MTEPDKTWITLSQASKTIPGRPSSSTIWRWIRTGIRTADGDRVRLRHIRVGRRIFISPDDLNRFFRDIAARDWQPRPQPRDLLEGNPIPAAHTEIIEARLRQAGI